MTSVKQGLDALDDKGRREYWATLALRCTRGLGTHSVCALLKHYGSAYTAYNSRSAWKDAGVNIQKNLTESDDAWRARAKPEWEAARTLRASIILWTDPRYPKQLRELSDAPALLYAAGNIDLLNAPLVAVVGSRECSPAAADMASSIAKGLSDMGVTIVSGMALGIDSNAHAAAMRGVGKTIAVLGTGVDTIYPACNAGLYRKIASQGLIISELPPKTPAKPGAFPMRNRIVSGLCLGVFVAEAASPKSGSLITARHAAENGRTVYVPAPDALRGTYREGTKLLLMEGAHAVHKAEHIIADLFPQLAPHALPPYPKPLKNAREDTASQKPAELQDTAKNDAASLDDPSMSDTALLQPDMQPSGIEEGKNAEAYASMSVKNAQESPIRRYPLKEKPLLARPKAALTPQTDEEDAVLKILARDPILADDLLYALREENPSMKWSAASISAVLMVLEVKGLARRRADSRYEAAQ